MEIDCRRAAKAASKAATLRRLRAHDKKDALKGGIEPHPGPQPIHGSFRAHIEGMVADNLANCALLVRAPQLTLEDVEVLAIVTRALFLLGNDDWPAAVCIVRDRIRASRELSRAFLAAGGEWNPGPLRMCRAPQTVAAYCSGQGARCLYDGEVIQSSRRKNQFVCAACGVVLGGPGMQPHPIQVALPAPVEEDDLTAAGLADVVGDVPPPLPPRDAVPTAPVPVNPAPVAAVPPAGANPTGAAAVTVNAAAAPTLPTGPAPKLPARRAAPRYQNSKVPPPSSTKSLDVQLDSPYVLDGRRLTDDEAEEFGNQNGALSTKLITERIQYNGEQRIATNRNVTELRQDVVVQRLVFRTISPALAPLFLLILSLWWPVASMLSSELAALPHHDAIAMTVASSITGTLGLAASQCKSPFKARVFYTALLFVVHSVAPCYGTLVAVAIQMLPFWPHLRWLFSSKKWGDWNVDVLGRRVDVTYHPFAFVGLCFVRQYLPPHLSVAIAALNVYFFAASRTKAQTAVVAYLFPRSEKTLWYVPHAGACALAEFSNGTSSECVVSTCRGKLLRLACLPLPDVMHSALLSGTEEVVKFLVVKEPFFEEGASFATVPL